MICDSEKVDPIIVHLKNEENMMESEGTSHLVMNVTRFRKSSLS